MITCDAGKHTLPTKLWHGMTCPHCVNNVRPCMECGQETTGSIGAAGVVWNSLCQTCKDKHDNVLKRGLEQLASVLDIVAPLK